MSYEPYPCDNCGKMILSDNDDFHFEVADRRNINVPNPDATTLCANCWNKEGYGKEYCRQQALSDLEYKSWLKGEESKMTFGEMRKLTDRFNQIKGGSQQLKEKRLFQLMHDIKNFYGNWSAVDPFAKQMFNAVLEEMKG